MKVLLSGLSSDRVEWAVAEGLAARGVQLTVIATPDSPAVERCRAAGLPCLTQNFRHRFDRRAVYLYRRLHREHRFDLIHTLTNRALSTALSARRRMSPQPPVIAYRGTMGHLHRYDPASWFSYLHPRLDTIVCVSDAVRRYLQTFHLPDDRLNVIWKGHDPSWYSPAPRDALAAFGIPHDATVACFTGNIRPVKGVDILLDAFATIPPHHGLHLLILGDVRDPSIARRIGNLPHVHFAGYRSDAPALAGACDISVMPSIEREGLPKATLEAMAQGVPAVVSNVGGLPELVEHEVSGLVVPPRDPSALRTALLRLAGDAALRARLGAAARERIAGPFHIQHTIDKTYALYQRLAAVHA
jgi:glycosyltransferase involved in cell wall biosynthesis